MKWYRAAITIKNVTIDCELPCDNQRTTSSADDSKIEDDVSRRTARTRIVEALIVLRRLSNADICTKCWHLSNWHQLAIRWLSLSRLAAKPNFG